MLIKRSIKGQSKVLIKGIDQCSTANALSTHDPGFIRFAIKIKLLSFFLTGF